METAAARQSLSYLEQQTLMRFIEDGALPLPVLFAPATMHAQDVLESFKDAAFSVGAEVTEMPPMGGRRTFIAGTLALTLLPAGAASLHIVGSFRSFR